MILRVRYQVAEPTVEHMVGLELRRSDGLLVHSSASLRAHPLKVDPNGIGVAEIEIPKLPLLAGSYEIRPIVWRVGLSWSNARSDGQVRQFSVWNDAEQAGVVALAPRWHVDGTELFSGAASASLTVDLIR